jgi:hypothetical protein
MCLFEAGDGEQNRRMVVSCVRTEQDGGSNGTALESRILV